MNLFLYCELARRTQENVYVCNVVVPRPFRNGKCEIDVRKRKSFGYQFGSIMKPFWYHFGSILVSFWIHFGIILDPVWYHFGAILVSFWIHFGIIFQAILTFSHFDALNREFLC